MISKFSYSSLTEHDETVMEKEVEEGLDEGLIKAAQNILKAKKSTLEIVAMTGLCKELIKTLLFYYAFLIMGYYNIFIFLVNSYFVLMIFSIF